MLTNKTGDHLTNNNDNNNNNNNLNIFLQDCCISFKKKLLSRHVLSSACKEVKMYLQCACEVGIEMSVEIDTFRVK